MGKLKRCDDWRCTFFTWSLAGNCWRKTCIKEDHDNTRFKKSMAQAERTFKTAYGIGVPGKTKDPFKEKTNIRMASFQKPFFILFIGRCFLIIQSVRFW